MAKINAPQPAIFSGVAGEPNVPIITNPSIVNVMPISVNPPKSNLEICHAAGKSRNNIMPALKNHQPSIGKIPGVHSDLMNESAAPNPSKPPKTMPIVPVNNSPRCNSTMASNNNATAQPSIQKPRNGADDDGTLPVANANKPKCIAPSR